MRYPKEVHTFIAQNVVGRTAQELAALTNARFGTAFTPASMKSYKQNHHLRSGTPRGLPKDRPTDTFPQEVRDYIFANYKGAGPLVMAQKLLAEFGLVYSKNQMKGFYGRYKLDSGTTGHFQKGNIPPLSGKKGAHYAGCEKSWFPKGHDPWNKLPVGSEIVRSDGHLWRKLGEGCRDWRQVHILNWEQAYGLIPPDHKIVFLDGDKTNCAIQNLKLVHNKVHLELNRRSIRSSDSTLTEVGIALAKLHVAKYEKRRTKKRGKHTEE